MVFELSSLTRCLETSRHVRRCLCMNLYPCSLACELTQFAVVASHVRGSQKPTPIGMGSEGAQVRAMVSQGLQGRGVRRKEIGRGGAEVQHCSLAVGHWLCVHSYLFRQPHTPLYRQPRKLLRELSSISQSSVHYLQHVRMHCRCHAVCSDPRYGACQAQQICLCST